jgi:hypothetical protein
MTVEVSEVRRTRAKMKRHSITGLAGEHSATI